MSYAATLATPDPVEQALLLQPSPNTKVARKNLPRARRTAPLQTLLEYDLGSDGSYKPGIPRKRTHMEAILPKTKNERHSVWYRNHMP